MPDTPQLADLKRDADGKPVMGRDPDYYLHVDLKGECLYSATPIHLKTLSVWVVEDYEVTATRNIRHRVTSGTVETRVRPLGDGWAPFNALITDKSCFWIRPRPWQGAIEDDTRWCREASHQTEVGDA